MEGIFIVFVIISVIVSIIGAASKQAKKSANPQQNRTYFPPLSVDTPQNPAAFRPIERFYSGPKVVPPETVEDYCEGSSFVSTEGIGQEGLASMEAVDYTSQETGPSEGSGKKRDAENDLEVLRAKALENGREILPVQENPAFAGSIKLFENQDAVVKAVIYSEILKPRFKH